MKTKKHIDRLFRERFKDFEVAPPPQAWENIAAALHNQKKQRKVVPLWLRFAGVAASLLLAIGIFQYFSNTDLPTSQQFTDVPVETQQSVPVDNETRITNVENQSGTVSEKQEVNTTEKQVSEKPEIQKVTTKEAIAETHKNTSSSQQKSENKIRSSEVAYGPTPEDYSNVVISKPTANEEISTSIVAESVAEKIQKSTEVEKDAVAGELTQVAVTEEKKSLIEYLQEREAEKQEIVINQDKPENRWMISPNVAPVYYNTLSNGSSIDPSLSNTPKSGEVNYSYGVQVGYAINNKLSVRTGINKVDVGYTTNNIEFAVAPASAGLQGLNYGGADYVVTAGVRGTLPDYSNQIPNVNGNQMLPRNENIEGVLSQQLGYFEVPLELKYSFLDSRFGINMVGGMSTFLLADNNVSVRSPEMGFETIIGEANNLNPISFSANLGLGFDYKISKRFVFNLEPMFKYQLNTYSDSEVDFRPYILGVYSGFSFKF